MLSEPRERPKGGCALGLIVTGFVILAFIGGWVVAETVWGWVV